VFAILGLRALHSTLAGMMEMFVYLKVGLSFVLGCWGQNDAGRCLQNPIGASLGVICGIYCSRCWRH